MLQPRDFGLGLSFIKAASRQKWGWPRVTSAGPPPHHSRVVRDFLRVETNYRGGREGRQNHCDL